MKYRTSEILAQKTLDASGTETIDINISDPISAILFEYKNTRGSNTNADHVAACLSKIELVDGSDVLFSLSGKQLHALDYYDKKQTPDTFLTNASGVMQLLGMSYNFGRKLHDPMLAFDPKKFTNPQLKITHDRVKCDASSSAHYLRVLGFLFDEKIPTPIGFLSSKEIQAYTSGADGSYKYIDLPTDRVMRKLLISGYDDAYSLYQVVSQIKISEDNDKRVVVDEPCSLLQKQIMSMYPSWEEALYAVVTAVAADFYCTPSFNIRLSGQPDTTTGYFAVETQPCHEPFAITGSGSLNAQLRVSGHLPHSTIPVLFGDQDDIDDWYDVTRIGSLQAILKAGSAGTAGAVAVFSQQLRRY